MGKLLYALADLVAGRWLRRAGSSTAAPGLGLVLERQMGIKQTVGGLPVDSFARGCFHVRLWWLVSHCREELSAVASRFPLFHLGGVSLWPARCDDDNRCP